MKFDVNYVLGFVISLVLMLIIMPFYIKALKKHNINQSVSEYALEEYKLKEKTPIMGGLLFVLIPVIVYFILANNPLKDKQMNFVILAFVLFCLVGFGDDIRIILKHNNEGLSPRLKLILEFVIVVVLYIIFKDDLNGLIDIPFINGGVYVVPFIFLPFIILLFLAEANAVNFTDGMDGLCAGVSFISLIAFVVFGLKANYYNLVLLLTSVMGGLIGYLCFNLHPAKIFMGDSGSLALGALFTSIAIILQKEVALFIVGGVFVWEMFCVCLQLTSVKLFHKRVFKYTPIHYAFVLGGMKEEKVVLMFYGIAIILTIIGCFIGLH